MNKIFLDYGLNGQIRLKRNGQIGAKKSKYFCRKCNKEKYVDIKEFIGKTVVYRCPVCCKRMVKSWHR